MAKSRGIGRGKVAGSHLLSPTCQAILNGLNEKQSAKYAAAETSKKRSIILNQAQYGNTKSPKEQETQKAWQKSRRKENGKAPAPSPLTSCEDRAIRSGEFEFPMHSICHVTRVRWSFTQNGSSTAILIL